MVFTIIITMQSNVKTIAAITKNVYCDEFTMISFTINNEPVTIKECILKNLILDQEISSTLISININTTINEYQPSSINELVCTNCKLRTIPTKLFTNLTSLEKINFSNCSINSITGSDFRNANQLIDADLSWNNIEWLSFSVFSLATNLTWIDLSYNKITVITTHALLGATKLKTLKLTNNRITTFMPIFLSSNLKSIHLDNNRLRSISFNLISSSVSKQMPELLLKNNNITDGKIFDTKNTFGILDISDNNIQSLPTINAEIIKQQNIGANELYISCYTSVIDASYNHISKVIIVNNENNEQIIANLSELNLSHNNLTNIQNLTNLSNLKILNLSFNKIATINENTFVNMTKLNVLKLEHCGIKYLPTNLFVHQSIHFLKYLDLSYNHLMEINFDKLSSLVQLETLYIDGNDLIITNSLIYEINDIFPQLHTIGLSDNYFNCTSSTNILKTLDDLRINLAVNENLMLKIRCFNSNNNNESKIEWNDDALPNHDENSNSLNSVEHFLTNVIERKFGLVDEKFDEDSTNHINLYNEHENFDDNFGVEFKPMIDLKTEISIAILPIIWMISILFVVFIMGVFMLFALVYWNRKSFDFFCKRNKPHHRRFSIVTLVNSEQQQSSI